MQSWSHAMEKVEVARRQLGTALALFLQNGDPVSVHTLACAGCEIAEHLTRKAGRVPFAQHILANFPDFDEKRLREIQRQYCNVFKHATTRGSKQRSDQELLNRFTDDVNDHTLYVGWHDYSFAISATDRGSGVHGLVLRGLFRKGTARLRYERPASHFSGSYR